MSVLEVRNLKKSFDAHTVVLRGVDFSLEKGETIAIIGSSGSGKTTLLRCLNFLTVPDEGQIAVNGETLFDAADPNTQKESEIRRKRLHFGLVFQNFNLFPQYTARQNVMLASELLAKEQPDYKARATRAQAKALLREGYRLMVPAKGGGRRPKRVTVQWIEEKMTLGQAGLILRLIRTGQTRGKQSWRDTVPARPFLGVTPQQAEDLSQKLVKSLLKAARA